MDLVSSDPAYMVTSFDSGHIGLFNMETQQLVLKFDSAGPAGRTGWGENPLRIWTISGWSWSS